MEFRNIFQNLNEPKKIKSTYFRLAQQFHPDHGGTDEIFRELNDEYLRRLKELDGKYFSFNENQQEYKFNYNELKEKEIINKINEFFSKAPEHLKLSLVGSWLWVENSEKSDKDFLKELSFRWSGSKKMWYFTTNFKPYHTRGINFDDIVDKYGQVELSKNNNILTLN